MEIPTVFEEIKGIPASGTWRARLRPVEIVTNNDGKKGNLFEGNCSASEIQGRAKPNGSTGRNESHELREQGPD